MRQPALTPGPAALLRRTPPWGLLLTLGLHLLLLASWRIAHPPAADTFGERVFALIPLPPPVPDKPAPRADAAPRAAPRVRSVPARRFSREAEAITAPAEAARPVVETLAPAPEAAPAEVAPDTMAARARRDALAIDRETRKGKSGVPEHADTAWGRFVGGLEDARKDSSLSITTDTYTTPDGQTIYRFRRGGRYFCRTSGFVRPRIGGAEGGGVELFDSRGHEGGAGQVRCPSQAVWKRD